MGRNFWTCSSSQARILYSMACFVNRAAEPEKDDDIALKPRLIGDISRLTQQQALLNPFFRFRFKYFEAVAAAKYKAKYQQGRKMIQSYSI